MTSQPSKRDRKVSAYNAVRLMIAAGVALLGVLVLFQADRQEPGSWPLALSAATAAAFIVIRYINEIVDERRLSQAAEDPHEALRRRIASVNTALLDAATLMEDLRRDLAAQQAAREKLLAQAEEQQRLLTVDAEQAEKIRQILIGETKATIRADRRRDWMLLITGALLSVPIGVIINLLVP